jgi:two-component system, OmpR family, phosphate regulon response regulator PhoB
MQTRMNEPIYRTTESGRNAWQSQDAAVPNDYRRLLWLMDFHGHIGMLSELGASYPKQVLQEWLGEMEQLGLIELVPEGESGQDFSVPDVHPPVEDYTSVERKARKAEIPLSRTGAFLAIDRVRVRPAQAKPTKETVILIVEDDSDQATLADLRMTMAGYQVRIAPSLNHLLQSLFDDGPPDLVLLDVELPDGNGFDILARMRRHKTMGDMPIVLLSSLSEAEAIGRGLALGADGYVTKPYTMAILSEVVRKVLNQ